MDSRRQPGFRRVLIAIVVVLCAGSVRAADTPPHVDSPSMVLGGDVTLSGTRRAVLALAGGIVVTDGTIGDAAMAAGNVHITGGDIARLAVTGGTVTFDGGKLGDVLAAAGNLKVNTLLTGDFRAVGGTIVTTRDAVIGGDAEMTGGDVIVDGTIKNSLKVRAEHIDLAGTIGGTVFVFGNDITVAPGTRIGGDLIYSAPEELILPPDVTIGGKVLRRDHHDHEQIHSPGIISHLFHAVWSIGFAGLLLCGLIIVLVEPTLLAAGDDSFVHRFGVSLLVGAVAACALPVAAAVLAVTLIGIPLAALLLASAGALAGFGLVIACRWAGDRVRTRFGRPPPTGVAQEVAWGLAGFGVFTVAGVVPFLGGIAQSVAILAGSGAALTALWAHWLGRQRR